MENLRAGALGDESRAGTNKTRCKETNQKKSYFMKFEHKNYNTICL